MQLPTKEQLREMEEAHAEGLHSDMHREFCPWCSAGSPLTCNICCGDHASVDCPALNTPETI